MLHLIYHLKLNRKARQNQKAFKCWLKDREEWFYKDIDCAKNPRWYVRTIDSDVHSLEHMISFDNEAAWGEYRQILQHRSVNPEWEKKRCEQEEWWEIQSARILNDYSLKHKDILE